MCFSALIRLFAGIRSARDANADDWGSRQRWKRNVLRRYHNSDPNHWRAAHHVYHLCRLYWGVIRARYRPSGAVWLLWEIYRGIWSRPAALPNRGSLNRTAYNLRSRPKASANYFEIFSQLLTQTTSITYERPTNNAAHAPKPLSCIFKSKKKPVAATFHTNFPIN